MNIYKKELDDIINKHFDEYVKNIKNQARKYQTNVTNQECQDIISNCYIKLCDKIENNNLTITTNMKHYFGMMTYNAYFDYLKEKPKIILVPLKSYQFQDLPYEEGDIDEQEHQKLILEIIQNLSTILTKQQFDIFIKRTINNKTCKEICIEMDLPYRKTTKEFSLAKEIILEKYGTWYEKINKLNEKNN
jgi:hypothetical protein